MGNTFWPAVLTLWITVEVVWMARKSCQRQERRRVDVLAEVRGGTPLHSIQDRLDWEENHGIFRN